MALKKRGSLSPLPKTIFPFSEKIKKNSYLVTTKAGIFYSSVTFKNLKVSEGGIK
jgi:hypothetical protein